MKSIILLSLLLFTLQGNASQYLCSGETEETRIEAVVSLYNPLHVESLDLLHSSLIPGPHPLPPVRAQAEDQIFRLHQDRKRILFQSVSYKDCHYVWTWPFALSDEYPRRINTHLRSSCDGAQEEIDLVCHFME